MIRSAVLVGVCVVPPACLLAEWLWNRRRARPPAPAPYSDAPALGWRPWGSLAALLAIVFTAVPVLGTDGAFERAGLVNAKGGPIGMSGLFVFLLVPFALSGVLVLAWTRFVERRSLATIGLKGAGAAPAYLRGHAIGLATSGALVAAIGLAGGYTAGAWWPAFGSPRALADAAILLACFAVQAGVEEILFRGWLLSAVARRLGRASAVVITSAVFTLLHYSPHQHALVTLVSALFSVFTCAWALDADDLWGVMGWHASWNWLIGTGFELPITGFDTHLPALFVRLSPRGPEVLTGGAEGPEGSVLCSLFFAGASALLLVRARRTSRVR